MRIGVITGTSVCDKNEIIVNTMRNIMPEADILDFGSFQDETITYSYIEISIMIGFLLSSQSVDFIITGCSSGQGMQLACNSVPGIICGYLPTAQDAFLFGRINNGNVASLPLSLSYGWAGEVNLRYILTALFDGEFGAGYPSEEAVRKKLDAERLKQIRGIAMVSFDAFINKIPEDIIEKILMKKDVIEYMIQNGKSEKIISWLECQRGDK